MPLPTRCHTTVPTRRPGSAWVAVALILPGLLVASLLAVRCDAADPELEALEVRTGTHEEAGIERARSWSLSAEDPEKARVYLETARATALAHPEDIDAVRHYVQVAVSQEQDERMLEDLRAFAAANPDRPEAHYYLGLAETGAARQHFERALELDPDFYHARVGLASSELGSETPDMAAAKSNLLRAASAKPSEPLAFIVLEQFYRRTGDEESRLLALAKAVEADPWDVRLRQMLLQQLQRQAQALQNAGGDIRAWADESSALLNRLARVGDRQPDLALAAARIWAAVGDPPKMVAQLQLAADLGFADPRGLSMDRVFASALEDAPGVEPILAQMQDNRADKRDELKAHAMEQLIDLALPPVASIPLLGGGTLDLASKRGKVVVLDFWATWCGPCRRSLPVLQDFYERKKTDVEVYCVNVFERDGGAQVPSFWESGGYPMPVALGTQDWANAFGVSSIPTLFLIGPDGRVRYRHSGFSPYLDEELAWVAEGLLAEE